MFSKSLSLMLIWFSFCVLPTMAQQSCPCDEINSADVQGAMNERRAGLYTGFADKRLARLGDQTARVIICKYSLDELRQETTAVAVASVIASSFVNSAVIANDGDKNPKVSALLLFYLRPSIRQTAGLQTFDLATQAIDRTSNASNK